MPRQAAQRSAREALAASRALLQVLPKPNATRPALFQPPKRDVLERHRNMDLMSEDELRAYAVQIGVAKRDAESLSVDRLKVNCHHVLTAFIESMS